MSLVAPFDLETIFIIVLAGSPIIFSLLATIFVMGLAAAFRMPNTIALAMMALFGVVMAGYLEGIYIIVILIAGLTSFYGISKLIR